VTGVAERVDGLRLESVEAIGKNLLLRFEGGVVLRSHLRMKGRWFVRPRGTPTFGRPWLVLRGERLEAVQLNGPVLELNERAVRRLGPDILGTPLDLDGMIVRFRAQHPGREVGEALLDQRLVAGIGNLWKAEALWEARLSPWRALADVGDDELRAVLEQAARLMRGAVDGVRGARSVYRRAGRPCPRCGEPVRSRGQGDDNRIAYWCPACQPGDRGVARAGA
jgi:endonuclease-8